MMMRKPENDPHRYDDMLPLPHHVSTRHAQMSMGDRAAQFSPFAALTGYEAQIEETARLTDSRIELTEDARAELDRNLQRFETHAPRGAEAAITYFVPDPLKEGGAYRTECLAIKRLDHTRMEILLMDGSRIPMEDVFSFEYQEKE